MVDRVNPPPHIPLPRKISADAELAPYHQQLGRILFQLWTRVGGGDSDAINALDELLQQEMQWRTDTEAQLETLRAQNQRLTGIIEELEKRTQNQTKTDIGGYIEAGVL